MVRRMYCLFVLSIIVTHGEASSDKYYETSSTIPDYIWYILGFLTILLLLVSTFLVYVLVKTKFLQNCNMCNKNKYTPAAEKVEEGSAQNQKWEKKSVRRLNSDNKSSELKNEEENNQTLKRQDSSITIKSDFSTIRPPKKSEGSGSVSPRIIKNVVKDMPIILPEQMSLICKEVLKRTNNKNDDSKGSLQNIDQLVKEAEPEVKAVLKYASTPELDSYDEPSTLRRGKKNSAEKNVETDIKNPVAKNISVENNFVRNKSDQGAKDISDEIDVATNMKDQSVKNICTEKDYAASVKNQGGSTDKSDNTNSTNQRTKKISLEESKAMNIQDSLSNKISPNDDLLTNCDIYDFPKELNSNALKVCDIYDLPKDLSSQMQKQSNYIEPYFLNKIPSENFKHSEEKPKYSLLKELSTEENKTKNEAPNSFNQDEHYEIPTQCNQMYINANDNLFTG